MRRAQAALEACEGARGACQARLEGMGQGSERCWAALEAERVRAPGMLPCTPCACTTLPGHPQAGQA